MYRPSFRTWILSLITSNRIGKINPIAKKTEEAITTPAVGALSLSIANSCGKAK